MIPASGKLKSHKTRVVDSILDDHAVLKVLKILIVVANTYEKQSQLFKLLFQDILVITFVIDQLALKFLKTIGAVNGVYKGRLFFSVLKFLKKIPIFLPFNPLHNFNL